MEGGLQRTMSMSSRVLGSETGRTVGGNSDIANFERQLQYSRKQADAASDTSSQRERKFAALLGGVDDDDDTDHIHAQNIGHRLYYTGCGRQRAREERLKDQRDRVIMQETAQLTQRPKITMRARSKPSKGAYFSEHAQHWNERRAQHIESLQRDKWRDESRELTGTPCINQKSRHIAETIEHQGPVVGWNSHVAKFHANQKPVTTEKLFQPNINANAVRTDVEKDISSRLFEDSTHRRERLKAMATEQRQKEMVDPHTGRPLFMPHSLRSTTSCLGESPDRSSRRKIDELSSQLHDDHRENMRKRELLEKAGKEANLSFQPQINPTSEVLASRNGVRKPLYVRKAKLEEQQREQQKQKRARSADAANKDDSKTHTSIDVDDFLRRIQRDELSRTQKMQGIRQEQMERELSECSFHPRISRRSEEIFVHTNMSGTPLQSPMETLASQSSGGMSPPPAYEIPEVRSGEASLPNSGRPSGQRLRFSSSPRVGAVNTKKKVLTPQQEFEAAAHAASSPSAPPTASSAQRRAFLAETAVRASPGRQFQQSPRIGEPSVENYIANFEKQMYSVLEEWRKLEDV